MPLWIIVFVSLLGFTLAVTYLFIVRMSLDMNLIINLSTSEFVITFIFILVGVILSCATWDIAHRPPGIKCSGRIGQKIQWASYQGGKNQVWRVYVTLGGDKEHYCLVESQELYEMGIGYPLAHDYQGMLKNKP